jgi:hypothetical protein
MRSDTVLSASHSFRIIAMSKCSIANQENNDEDRFIYIYILFCSHFSNFSISVSQNLKVHSLYTVVAFPLYSRFQTGADVEFLSRDGSSVVRYPTLTFSCRTAFHACFFVVSLYGLRTFLFRRPVVVDAVERARDFGRARSKRHPIHCYYKQNIVLEVKIIVT